MRLAVLTPRRPPPSPAAIKELETENPALFHLWLRSGEPLGPYLAKRDRGLSTPLLSRAHRMTCALPAAAPHDWPPAGRQEGCLTVPGPGVVSRLQPDGSQHSPMPHWQGLATPMAGAQSQQGHLHHGGSQPSPARPWRELAQPRHGHHSTPPPQQQQQWPLPQQQPQPQQRLPQQWQQPPLSQHSQLSQLSPPQQQRWQLTTSPQCPPPFEGGSRLQLASAPTLGVGGCSSQAPSQHWFGPCELGSRQAHSQPRHDYRQEAVVGRGDQPDAWPAAGLGLREVRWSGYDVGPARSSSLHLSGSTPPPASAAAPVGSLPLSSSSTHYSKPHYSTPPPASAPAQVGSLQLSDGTPPPVSAAEVARLPCATQQPATRPTHARLSADCPPRASAAPVPSKPAQAFDVLMAAQKHLGSTGAPAEISPRSRSAPGPAPRPAP